MSVRIGRICGIPVEVHATWVIIFGLLAYTVGSGFISQIHNDLPRGQALGYGALAAFLLFMCLMAHELMHALAARKCGIRTGVITLFLFGGAAQLSREPNRPGHEFSIAIAGPLCSLGLSGLFFIPYIILPAESVWCTISFYLAFSNGLLGIVNLLPGYPLDGGRVFRAFLWWASRNRTMATRVATLAGEGIGLASIAYGAYSLLNADTSGIWLVMIGWYVSDAAAKSWEHERIRSMLEKTAVADIVTRRPVPLSPADTLAQAICIKNESGESVQVMPVANECGPIGYLRVDKTTKMREQVQNEKRVGDVMAAADSRVIAEAYENAWEVVERMEELHDNEAILVADGNQVLGIVEKRRLPEMLSARLKMAA